LFTANYNRMTSAADMPHTVLIVEDEGLVRCDAAETLRDAGLDVLEAADAEQALALVDGRDDIAVLFTDIDMPGGMNGLELARRVRRLHPDIRLLLTSGQMTPTRGELPANGDFIAKPYSPETMTRAVVRMLG